MLKILDDINGNILIITKLIMPLKDSKGKSAVELIVPDFILEI